MYNGIIDLVSLIQLHDWSIKPYQLTSCWYGFDFFNCNCTTIYKFRKVVSENWFSIEHIKIHYKRRPYSYYF